MGVMTFQLPTTLPAGARAAVERARFAGGYDHTPFPSTVRLRGDHFLLTRAQNESGYVTAPWPVPQIGFPVTTSATLRERPEAYRFLVELARGKVNQVRTQAAEWEMAGLTLDAETLAQLAAVTRLFGKAVLNPNPSEADASALEALTGAYQTAERAVSQYATTLRSRHAGRWPRLGCRLDAKPKSIDAFAQTFTAVRVVPDWSTIEAKESNYDWAHLDDLIDWAKSNDLEVSVGPLIDLSGAPLPRWLEEWHGDLPSMATFLCDFVETAIHRYRGRVKEWLLCTGFNHTNALGLAEDDRLRLTAKLLDAARAAEPDGRWVIGLTQPWGDYLDHDEYTYSPLVFADTLLRSGLPVAGFELELVTGDSPAASHLRDRLDTLQLFELFSNLGVPLDVLFSHPGKSNGDATTSDSSKPTALWLASDSGAAQAEWGGRLADLCLCLPQVRSLYWGRWQDTPHDATGVVGLDGTAKPLLAELQRARALMPAG